MEETLTDEQIKQHEDQLLSKVPSDGSRGNVSLIRELGWTSDRYWLIRNRLIDNGVLEKGRGQGGSVSRVKAASSAAIAEPTPIEPLQENERDLYPKIAPVLQNEWAKDSRVDQIQIEITGQQGSRTTGKWARPDLTAILYRVFPYVPGKQIETVVFEVKPSWSIDVTAVYEALGHRRAANRAYVILVHDQPDQIEDRLIEIFSEARKLGIGVIVAKNPNRYEEWEIAVEAVRHDPDPEKLNDFLASQVSQTMRDTLMKWFK